MLRLLFGSTIFLLLCMTNIYAGTPASTDSTATNMQRPTAYMYKFLNIDRTNVNNAAYTVEITALNTASASNCPDPSTATSSVGESLTGIRYVQIGIFGQVPRTTYLHDTNLYSWGGSLWDNVTWTQCDSGCCTNNCPYWVYNYSSLKIICAPMFSDWRAAPI